MVFGHNDTGIPHQLFAGFSNTGHITVISVALYQNIRDLICRFSPEILRGAEPDLSVRAAQEVLRSLCFSTEDQMMDSQ